MSTSSAGRTTSPATSKPGSVASSRASSTPSPGATTPAQSRTPATGTSAQGGGGFSFSQLTPYLKQGWKFAQFGTQIAQQFGGARGAPSSGDQPAMVTPGPAAGPTAGATSPTTPSGTDVAQPGADTQPPPSGVPDAGVAAAPDASSTAAPPAVDQLSFLLQALQQRQIPALPGTAPQMAGSATAVPGVAPQADGLALLRLILTNPHFQQTLHMASSMGAAGPRAVSLPVPVVSQPRKRRAVQIPLGAIMNAIALLARRSMTELNATTQEDEPEVPSYLVNEHGDYIVNPADAIARASLVTRWFELSEEAELAEQAEQAEQLDEANEMDETAAEMDESDEWAEDAGFTM